MPKATVKDTMTLLDEFLGTFRKEAFEASAEQSALGKEQEEEAKKGGATASEARPADTKDKNAMDTENELAPVRTGAEDSLAEKSEVVDKVKKEVVTENLVEKAARAERLGNAILNTISAVIDKEAAANTPKNRAFQKIAAESAAAAQEYYEAHLAGRLQRMEDEAELRKANLPKEVLQKVGGISGLLDKIAMEDPAAVMPPGMAMDGAPVGDIPAEDISEEELDALAEELTAAGMTPEDLEAMLGEEAAGMEAAPLAGEGEGVAGPEEEAMIDDLAAQLDEAGVTPEDLVAAFEDIEALQEAGVTPEELAQAVEEMVAEEEGAAPEMAAEEVPAEIVPEDVPAEDVPKEAAAQNVARQRIDAIKARLMA
jgi:hypothetical protein